MSDTRYTNEGIRKFLIKVIRMALTAGGYTGTSAIPIIVSNQNAPAPALPYLSVDFSGITTRQGNVTRTDLIPYKENEDDEEYKYKRYLIQDVEKVFTITEEGGTGTLLDLITDSMELASIRAAFELAGIALLRVEDISPRPQLFNEDWQVGATVDLILGVPAGLEEISDYISDVTMSGELNNPE